MNAKHRMLRSSVMCVLLLLPRPVSAGDRPNPFLKDVKIVSYQVSVQQPNTGPCATDLNAWNTTIDSVANQSTKLKLIREQDHLKQARQLSEEANKAVENVVPNTADNTTQAPQTERDKVRRVLYAPSLLFSIVTTDVAVGCAGTVSAELSVGLEPSKIIATETSVDHPYMTVWSSHQIIKGSISRLSSLHSPNERGNN